MNFPQEPAVMKMYTSYHISGALYVAGLTAEFRLNDGVKVKDSHEKCHTRMIFIDHDISVEMTKGFVNY